MTYRIRLAAMFDGKEGITWEGGALLPGIPVRELADAFGGDQDITRYVDMHDLPLELKQLGRRRASEAKAWVDSELPENPAIILAYWAKKTWGDEVTLSADDGEQMLLHTENPDIAAWFAPRPPS